MLANLISSWHRASLKKKMKAEGIKFSPRPLGGPLLALPCRWMVLSCVMLSMWSVAMAGPVLQPTPVTWVAALGRVRDLRHPLLPPPPPKPPDPPDLSSVELSPSGDGDGLTSTDGEGEGTCGEGAVNQLKPPCADAVTCDDNQLKPPCADAVTCVDEAWLDLTICRPCDDLTTCSTCSDDSTSINTDATRAPTNWDDFDEFATGWRCFLSRLMPSFGPLGLLSAAIDTPQAFVDTAASITVTPFKEDFVEYESVQGSKVIKGLTAGATIQGRGVVHWRVEVGSKVVDLKLRALHVPTAEHRLLCPQQMRKEHKPKPKKTSIEDDWIELEFAEGTVECPYNENNLPVLTLCAPKEADDSLKALNACVTMENNQNLNAAQKELLKWHCRLGHSAFP